MCVTAILTQLNERGRTGVPGALKNGDAGPE